ncbi:Coenzyme F420 hydrogenase subunit alpha [Methanosarcina barkeri str. Wiesmoor]|uniref:Coenzyme F420 hydrogenase subunit alpha n=3 Tax=Methanosarcina barkeri TaxID=2208 RepID=A0A0E3QP92_METBA|nr:coenzyme F420 hydrogenase subunit alpha [Methanosarcina barkeri]AKB51710.1 Coenzyme F420 hydrogenase subunit alpha [Methanosarcina barkeri str. Wiesmoor]CAA74094.1 F420-reducing hydrogenase isoenzyme I alpha subunit [Methanosarcina barkeri]
MTKVVEISPTTRHEGHSKLTLKVNDEGIVERGDWLSTTPVRGIEKLAIGKTMDQVPKIASRVCGICPIAHTLAGIEAMEASIGCEIPKDAKLLRVILHAANRLHSHALHNILILPDFYIPDTETKINPFSKEQPLRSVAVRIFRIREIAQTIGAVAGGEAIHPSNPRVGGMYRNVSSRAKQKIADLAKEGLVLAHEQMEFMIEVIRNMQDREFVEVAGKQIPLPKTLGYHNQGVMATAPMYGSSSLDEKPMWDFTRWRETRPWDWYMSEETIDLEDSSYPIGGTTKVGTKVNPRMEACNTVPTYDGQPVEVGPRARLATFKHFTEKGTFAQHIARQMEYTDCYYTILNCLENLDTSGKVLADTIPLGNGSMGWAANEAPRGTDVHLARVKDGKVLRYEMLVPTTWNFPTCSRALTGAPWQIAEMVIRAYDPCVSCATHMIVVNEEDRIVAQKLMQW